MQTIFSTPSPGVTRRMLLCALALVSGLGLAPGLAAQTAAGAGIGVVLMHGKGGAPDSRVMAPLASALEAQGVLLRNLEMPWSARRGYDADVASAEAQVAQALAELKAQGAQRLFVAGHSQGGLFALHLAALWPLDGVVALAPGGNVGASIYAQKLGAERDHAKALVDAGQGDSSAVFADYEGSKGVTPVRTRADWYWSWFDPLGAMNQELALRAVRPGTPVLYVAPTQDYPALRAANPGFFALLPPGPFTRFEQPVSSHLQLPREAAALVLAWLLEVAWAADAPGH